VPESPRDPAHRDRPDWKGSRPRARRLSFGLRLGLALAGSMLIAVVGIGVVSSRLIADGLIDQGARSQRADARSIEAAFSEAGSGERAIEEAAEVVGGLANRPDVLEVFLVNAHGTVVASHDPRLFGTREPNPHFGAALREGRSYAGRESESGEASEFEFVTPLRLGRERYALEIDQDGRAMDDQIATLRQSTLLVSGAGLLLGLALFYGLGGRSLLRRHGAVVRRATRDPLTDLGNHRLFQDELARAVSFAARRNEPLALALLDLDDFKLINDRDGHPKGDEALVDIARVLETGRREDRAFRIGGDEFALLMASTDGEGARIALDHRRATAREGGMAATFTGGIAVLTPDGDTDPAVLWEQADAALYEGKRTGGDQVVLFDDVAELLSVVTPAKVRALHSLLDEPRLEIAFQPIWQLSDDRMLGLEALARPWEGYGFAGPAEAFAVAEKVGRGPELDALCRAAALARADELPADTLLFLNLSPQTLERDSLSGDRLVRAVRDAGLEPERVVLEITERAQARLEQVVAEAARLRGLGFRIALDDVGVGNSGLEMLRRLDLDFVKVDRSIIAGAVEDVNVQAVLVAIVAYAHRAGAFVIAEGIESPEMLHFVRNADELDIMRNLSIEGGQGFLLGRPSRKPEYAQDLSAVEATAERRSVGRLGLEPRPTD
jgi:diguanylate cyclase (GGDEF)-like protein